MTADSKMLLRAVEREARDPVQPAPIPRLETQIGEFHHTGEKLNQAMAALTTEITSMLETSSSEGANILSKLKSLTEAVLGTRDKVVAAKEDMRKYFERLSGEVLAATELARRFSSQCESMRSDLSGGKG